jgi:phage terminase large subunit GpA-like protein
MLRHPAIPELRSALFAALRPPAKLDMAEWMERNVRLPSSLAAQSGPMRLFPYQTDIARSIGDPAVERVTVMKSARLGISQLAVGGVGHFAINDPASQLVVLPSEADCRMMMTAIVEPTFEASPTLRHTLRQDTSGRDTLYSRRYPGGSLDLVSGGSPKNLRARTARVLWLDEVDGLEVSAGNEGDPVELAIRRTMTFPNRKIVAISTPVDEATSRIMRAYETGDQRIYECPCPHCATSHEVKWADIRWPEGEPERAYWACPSCGGVVAESDKAAFVAAGAWRATREAPGHHSYRLNSLISTLPAAAWGRLAVEFLAAKRDPFTLKTFVNTVLGEAWRDDSEGMDDSDIASRAEPIGLDRLPLECIGISGGVDVQHDRLELSTLGWTADGAAMVLAHEVFWGDPLKPDVWLELDVAIKRQFRHPLAGAMLPYDAVLVDSSDGNTMEAVYNFCRGRTAARVFACKGNAGWKLPIVQFSQQKTARLQIVGVDTVKLRIADKVKARSFRFSDTLTPAWFEMFTCERLQVRYSRGVPVREWHRLGGRRAEAWDCCVYAVAAWHAANVNTERRGEQLKTAAAPSPKRSAVIRSKWLEDVH